MSVFPTAMLAAALLASPAFAAPGAHGPNGEHLDSPSAAGGAPAAPRVEAHSELFELVGTLSGGELSILVDRYHTNEPVLNGRLEVESGAHKAVAKFHADLGDYSVDDAAFLQAIGKPGEHPLVFTIAAAGETDLLDGTLRVGAAGDAHDDDKPLLTPRRTVAAGAALLLAIAGTWYWTRRRAAQGALR